MLVITDLKDETYALLAQKTVKKELNGSQELQLIVHQQKNNSLDLKLISEMWTLTYQNIDYKIVYLEQITRGHSFYLSIRAVPLFYDEFSTSIIHYREDGSVTAVDCFERIFANTSFNYRLVNSRSAKTWDNFGNGENRWNLFAKAINKFNLEWYIEGSTVYLVDLVGDDTQFLYKYKLNASNIKRNVDATAYYTHIKGFGDYEDSGEKTSYLTDAKLKLEYTHPLADLVGKREAPPVTDGRIKHKDTLIESMKAVIDNSLNITVEATLHDLRNQGYSHGIPKLGDRTFLIDERIDLKQEIRVYSIIEKYDEQDKLKDCQVDFGSQSIRKRYKANVKAIEKAMQDILEGRIELPYNVLDGVAKDMLSKIKSASSELIFDDGIFAVDKSNPNLILGLNSNGLFISTDGGATADTVMTADGLVANAITSGEILTHLVRVVGTEGLFYIDGDVAKWINPNDAEKYVEISPNGVHVNKGAFSLTGYDGRYIFQDGKMRNQLMANIQIFDKTFDGVNVYTDQTDYKAVYVIRDVYRGNQLELSGTAHLDSGTSADVNYLDIAVTRFGLDDPEPYHYLRHKLVKTNDPSIYSFRMSIDMKSIFNKIVDYQRFDWYVKIKLVNNNGLTAAFRLNRGEWND